MKFQPLTLRFYHLCASAFRPLAPLLLSARLRRGKEDPARWRERQGEAGRPRPDGPLCWMHGASVGEAVTMLPLAHRLIARGCKVLMTTGTVTSAAVMAQRLPEGAVHQYVPLDVPAFVTRFLDHWEPDMAVFAESELWPSMLAGVKRRRVPLILVNGRMSRRSFGRWQRAPATIRAMLRAFDLCLAQSVPDGERLASLGAPQVLATGNLKFDVPPPPADEAALLALRQAIAGRPVWLAASSHEGEESLAAAVHARLAPAFPGLLTLLAPRHPERGGAIRAALTAGGLTALRRSTGDLPGPSTAVYVADTMGEMGLLYRVARVVFVGGSLVRHGGQNPVEPAKLGAAVLHGPHVHNFVEAYAALDGAGGALAVSDGAALADQVARLLSDEAAAQAVSVAAAGAVAALSGALDRTMAALEPTLARLVP
jgi:3-deoxy-D-manno-octulosonic-acid transferase